MWAVVGVQVSGAGNDNAQSWLQALLLKRLADLPEVRLLVRRVPDGVTGGSLQSVPQMRLHLAFTPRALQLQMLPASGFGPEYAAYMPLALRPGETAAKAVAQHVEERIGEGLQALLAMQEADASGAEPLRKVAAGKIDAAVRPLSPPGQLALQTFAIRRVAERRDKAAAPILRALVTAAAEPQALEGARALGLQAVGSSMALCDREAVLPIVALAQHQEPAFIVPLAHAIAQIGGPMAEAYLVTLASGHLDAEVRLGATAALEALQQGRRTGSGCGAH